MRKMLVPLLIRHLKQDLNKEGYYNIEHLKTARCCICNDYIPNVIVPAKKEKEWQKLCKTCTRFI